LGSDPKKELETISKWGASSDVTGDPEEVAIKFLGLSVLYGLKENARRIVLVKDQEGGIQFQVEAAGTYRLPSPSPALAKHAFQVMRGITHLEANPSEEALALGLKNDRLELGIAFDAGGGKERMSISFPPL
jgi:hypothetical protein